jgi:dTDP-4-dehydrorhamnose reductase
LERRRILLTGADGQLGWELARTLPCLGEVIAPPLAEFDFSNRDAARLTVERIRPDLIVNAAGYTHVDRAESEPAVAHLVNAEGPELLANEAARLGATVVQFSSDYVFNGRHREPYSERDEPAPINAYGRSKAAGERAVLRSGADAYIFRLAWVFSLRGRNFLNTIRDAAAHAEEVRVVKDQHGTPTWARLAAGIITLALAEVYAARRDRRPPPPTGIYHVAAPEPTTWYEFAAAIVAALPAPAHGARTRVTPVSTDDFAAEARRPPWSVLDASRFTATFGLTLPPWQEQLALCLAEV